jgi:hypothetical protein
MWHQVSRLRRLCVVLTLLAAWLWGTLGTATAGDGVRVTFSGFQRGKSGDGVLFVHTSDQTGFSVKSEGSRVVVRLSGASIDVRNNLHPLDLSHFGLLLVSSRLVEVNGDIEVRLELRRPTTLEPRWVERKDGLASLHVPIPPL